MKSHSSRESERKEIIRQQKLITKHEKTIEKQKQIIARQLQALADSENALKVKDQLYLEATKVIDGLLKLLTTLIELRDPYTKGHSVRVMEISLLLARHPNLESHLRENLVVFGYACLLHDIGKIVIPDYILNKPVLLTEAERLMIQQHTELGFKLVEPLDLNPIIGEVILNHHENFDGTGYPARLKGKEIPLTARIVRIADVFDALTSDRPYRKAYSLEQALSIMEKQKSQFDPELYKIFLSLVRENKILPPAPA
ncbi:MAG: HD-GYP domain-containing protein [Candidatus Aminicenantes bacterium]|nr:HD-GYP domain-containing protein [Candidatus Aminicenantes bacterium]